MDIITNRKFERQRIEAVLDSILALCFLIVCSFTLFFIYTINNEGDASEGLIIILTIPLILNGLQLLVGIILLFLTRKKTNHLNKCKQWCSVSKYLTAIIFIEMFVLLQFQFKSLAFGLFGIQYLTRLVAIQKVRIFMENLILRNLGPNLVTSTTVSTGGTIIPHNDLVYTSLNSSTNNPSNNNNNNSRVNHVNPTIHIHSFTHPESSSRYTFDRNTGQLHIQFSSNSPYNFEPFQEIGMSQELPPPSYNEAMAKVNSRTRSVESSHSINSLCSIDQPPSYNDAIKARARMHWKLIALHRKNNGKSSVFAQTFI